MNQVPNRYSNAFIGDFLWLNIPQSETGLKTCESALLHIETLFDYEANKDRLAEIELELSNPEVWANLDFSQSLTKEQASLRTSVQGVERTLAQIQDSEELLSLAIEEQDTEVLEEIDLHLDTIESTLKSLELQKMFSHELDAKNAYIDIQFGEGGTESQDWASMLFRMYVQWCEKSNFKYRVVEFSNGDIAGIRSSTMLVQGDHAYGWLRTETGVHRLVRNSPFDSNHRRHTSFASVFVYAEIDDDVEVEIDPSDVRTDTYRASGAGGQHVNQTDSAVRLTHLPTKTVVQCQSERSQHKNRAQAWKQLRAKLFYLIQEEKQAERQALEDAKPKIGFGSQIRSYVLDQSRVKDHRTGVERSDPDRVLNGDLKTFMEASLLAGI